MRSASSASLLAAWILTLAVLVPLPGSATTYVLVSDETLADRADVIAEVRVLEVDASPGVGRPVTDYLMAVERVIHGDVVASPLTVRMLGGILPDGMGLHIYGAPNFVEGQRALLFLRHRPDGTYRILDFMLGAFHVVDNGGDSFALRRLSEAEEIALPGRVRPRDGQRNLERFRAWLEDRTRGVERPADYFVEPAEGDLPEKFTILTSSGRKIRWQIFDTGGSVTFRAHQDGQPGLSGGGFTQFRTGLTLWTNDPNTPIDYRYGGTTSETGGFTTFDNVNAILFDDPNDNDEFDGPFSCSGGGSNILALGGPWFDTQDLHQHNGETFNTTVGGDIVTNKNVGCFLSQGRSAEEVFAHELGHTLGLGHSTNSGALMWPNAHGGNFGARLTSDDRAGIRFLYGEPVTAPAAPSNLTATAVSGNQIDLTWSDNSTDEESFDLERSTGGTFNRIALPAANSTSYQDTTVQPGVTYTYRLRAFNDGGTSAFSNTATATTVPPPPPPPSDLSAFGASESQIRLFWSDDSIGESGFEIEGRTGGGPFTLFQTAPANDETALIEGLNPVTTYTFRVRAVGAGGSSGYTNEASTITFFAGPDPCVAGPTTLCLGDGRFKVEVTWTDFIDQTGPGTDAGLASTDSGLFYFFFANNWEMLVKVLDACAGETRHFWVFAAATTDVAYDLVVTDSVSGFSKTYSNELGVASPAIIDTGAFATCFAEAPEASPPPVVAPTPAARFENKGSCVPSDTRFCFNGGRFAVELEWRNFAGGTGLARVDPLQSGDSGLLYFVDPQNLEVLVKVLDGCAINGRVWVFAAATTNFEYTLRVTDTVTDVTNPYPNPLGNAAAAINDTLAFDACPPP